MQEAQVVMSGTDASVTLARLRDNLTKFEVQRNFYDRQQKQLADEINRASPTERPMLEVRLAMTRAMSADATKNVDLTRTKISALEGQRQAEIAGELAGQKPAPATQITVQPAPEHFLNPEQVMQVFSGGALLLFPFVIVLARQLWLRGSRRVSLDPEKSPRLQRIEEAVEAIALEVERIGEAQRFTTKLLAERQPEAMPRVPAARKEPGVITPH
jgi:hypothetical protein